jgi:hypothetical protein
MSDISMTVPNDILTTVSVTGEVYIHITIDPYAYFTHRTLYVTISANGGVVK